MLRRRGVSAHDSDEAIQETAARAMSTGVEFSDADDLFRWASVVSWRVAIDARRRCRRVSDLQVPDRPDHTDVAQAAENRIVLSAVTNKFKELPERDRAVLLSSFDDHPTPSRLQSVRVAVARHRARNRLRALLNGLLAPLIALLARRRGRSQQIEALIATTSPALVCLALTVGMAVAPTPPSAPAPQPATERPVTSPPARIAERPVEPAASTSSTAQTKAHSTTSPSIGWSIPLPGPPGKRNGISSRPRQPDDHLACATLPSLTGPSTTCVDPPALGR